MHQSYKLITAESMHGYSTDLNLGIQYMMPCTILLIHGTHHCVVTCMCNLTAIMKECLCPMIIFRVSYPRYFFIIIIYIVAQNMFILTCKTFLQDYICWCTAPDAKCCFLYYCKSFEKKQRHFKGCSIQFFDEVNHW